MVPSGAVARFCALLNLPLAVPAPPHLRTKVTLYVHMPAVHAWNAPQVVPQAPQLFASVWVLVQVVSQQSGVAPSAGQKPAPQVSPQTPLWHISPVAQIVAQEPQCAVSVLVLTQIVPQQVSPVPHEHWIVPPHPSEIEPQKLAGQVPPGVQQALLWQT